MASDCRRCFGATSCNCIIQAGVGTTINGDGTALSPYVIDADGGAAANTSVVTPVTTFGNVIARHDDGTGNSVDIIESVVEFSRIVNIDGSETITVLPEDNVAFTFTIPSASALGGTTNGSLTFDPATGLLTLTDSAGAFVTTTLPIDQTATTVPSTASGNLTSTNVQDALEELQGDIDNLLAANADNIMGGSGAPTGADGEDGEFYYDVDTGDYYGPKTGGVWGPVIANDRVQVALADAILVATAAGDGGVATTAARSDHRHVESTGPALPNVDGSGGIRHILVGHASLPDSDYSLIDGQWVQS